MAVASPAEVLPVAAAAGEVLLRCGADVARVEDTIVRVAQAYGIAECDTFVTPTGLFISLGADHHLTVVKRVQRRTMALDRVSAVNNLSRDLSAHPLPPAEALKRIREIDRQSGPVPAWTEGGFSALAAAACTMLVGGHGGDFLPALLANVLVQVVERVTAYLRLPEALGDFLAGAVAVGSAVLLHWLVGSAIGPVVAGGIMVLLPGTAFTASVRDAMAGDLLSSGARGLEALMKAAALAGGVAFGLSLAGGLPL